jgi:uncharacterized protein YgiM (DUF1202 family)
VTFIVLSIAIWFFFFRHKGSTLKEAQIENATGPMSVFSGKGDTNRVIGTIGKGDKIKILEESDMWSKIQIPGGMEGYINTALLKSALNPLDGGRIPPVLSGQSGQPGQSGQSGQTGGQVRSGPQGPGDDKAGGDAYVNIRSGHLNVREAKGTNSKIIATLLKGEKVQLLDTSDSWYKIRLPNGVVGYVDSRYLKTTPP